MWLYPWTVKTCECFVFTFSPSVFRKFLFYTPYACKYKKYRSSLRGWISTKEINRRGVSLQWLVHCHQFIHLGNSLLTQAECLADSSWKESNSLTAPEEDTSSRRAFVINTFDPKTREVKSLSTWNLPCLASLCRKNNNVVPECVTVSPKEVHLWCLRLWMHRSEAWRCSQSLRNWGVFYVVLCARWSTRWEQRGTNL